MKIGREDTRHVCEEIWGRTVCLTKDGKRTWFDQGWHDFVEYHSITAGYFLIFKYEKNSNFHVLVFDLSACEINYSYYNREELEIYVHKYSMHPDEMESEDSAELVHFRTPKPTSSSFEKNFPDKRRDEFELMAALDDAGISLAGRFRSLAAEERERALNVAKLLKPRKPSFMVILRSYHTFSFRKQLYVPVKFANKYLSKDLEYIKLQASDGKEYPVQIIWKQNNGVSFRKGWAGFSRDKNMEEGDICVFELVRMKEDILLKVSVFHETTE
ncbi:hypothetical protein Ddye_003776 [Dipteronia dyeriana]|uniref:TF-B3 domain-containing protein n=1 Tax=Dipteronia dyeriana TaxID=168575 RepID=A0AAE0CVL6_9ROSI|nr:hypothetical protein Ddye_003776 [Dipteronia dyeriana]